MYQVLFGVHERQLEELGLMSQRARYLSCVLRESRNSASREQEGISNKWNSKTDNMQCFATLEKHWVVLFIED